MSEHVSPAVRNVVAWRHRLDRLRGGTVRLDLAAYDAPLQAIAGWEEALRGERDAGLAARAARLRRAARDGAAAGELRVETFALVREAARRTIGLRPFDVQVVAALALADGTVVEMQTGEGKTLVATMRVALAALAGEGVHVLATSDYLARRDAEWMGPVYRALGLAVGFVTHGMDPAARRRAYAADVTYVTVKEAGFDFLRDQLVADAADRVHRGFHVALVDEADSILVDEARVPLVIAGRESRAGSSAERLAGVVAALVAGRDFETDEPGRNVQLTDRGLDRCEAALGRGDLLAAERHGLLAELHCALHARALLARDVDYLVRDGRIELVDELTGRVIDDRHWPDGLQAALEAKEGLAATGDGRVLGAITVQHYLGLYDRLAGMTGTARDAAREIDELYDLEVVVVPTHRPAIRVDHADRLYTHRAAKEAAVVREIEAAHERRRPVLVGTASVAESERLATRLREAGVPCRVLNARQDAQEAEIVARAGGLGAVTIATNMAGRGTDIRLGGPDEADRDAVVALGGLYVLGTNRHESLRVDRQLRGRAGRQGDPGTSRFFVALDDPLLQRYGIDRLIPERVRPAPQDGPLELPLLHAEVDRAQRIVDGQNREIRRTLWRYSTAIEDQRRAVQEEREDLLLGRHQPDAWASDPERRAALVAAVGEAATRRAEVTVTLHHLDRAWSDHLGYVAELREGNHLVGLAGEDPRTAVRVATADAFHRLRDDVDAASLATLRDLAAEVERGATTLDLAPLGIQAPAATWTYQINDDPFRQQLAVMLTGPGATTMSIGTALVAPLLLVLWSLAARFWKRPEKDGSRAGREDDGSDE